MGTKYAPSSLGDVRAAATNQCCRTSPTHPPLPPLLQEGLYGTNPTRNRPPAGAHLRCSYRGTYIYEKNKKSRRHGKAFEAPTSTSTRKLSGALKKRGMLQGCSLPFLQLSLFWDLAVPFVTTFQPSGTSAVAQILNSGSSIPKVLQRFLPTMDRLWRAAPLAGPDCGSPTQAIQE